MFVSNQMQNEMKWNRQFGFRRPSTCLTLCKFTVTFACYAHCTGIAICGRIECKTHTRAFDAMSNIQFHNCKPNKNRRDQMISVGESHRIGVVAKQWANEMRWARTRAQKNKKCGTDNPKHWIINGNQMAWTWTWTLAHSLWPAKHAKPLSNAIRTHTVPAAALGKCEGRRVRERERDVSVRDTSTNHETCVQPENSHEFSHNYCMRSTRERYTQLIVCMCQGVRVFATNRNLVAWHRGNETDLFGIRGIPYGTRAHSTHHRRWRRRRLPSI